MKLAQLLSVASLYEYVCIESNDIELIFDEARNVKENIHILEKEVECFYSGTRNNNICTIVILKGVVSNE